MLNAVKWIIIYNKLLIQTFPQCYGLPNLVAHETYRFKPIEITFLQYFSQIRGLIENYSCSIREFLLNDFYFFLENYFLDLFVTIGTLATFIREIDNV